jgi:hypothetical protein
MRWLKQVAVSALVITLVIGGVTALYFARPWPLNLRIVRGIKPGVTKQEILHIFGPPQQVHEVFGDYRFCYYRTGEVKIVYLIFDTNGLYKGFELDD